MHFHGSTWFWSSVSLFDLWFTFRHRAQQHHTPGGNKFDLLKDEKKSGVAKASDGIPWFIWSMLAFFLVLELISLIPSLRCCTFPFDGNSLLTDFIYGWVFFFTCDTSTIFKLLQTALDHPLWKFSSPSVFSFLSFYIFFIMCSAQHHQKWFVYCLLSSLSCPSHSPVPLPIM